MLCLGIENADKSIRLEVSKGKFEDVDIKKIVKNIHEADIDIMAIIFLVYLEMIRIV